MHPRTRCGSAVTTTIILTHYPNLFRDSLLSSQKIKRPRAFESDSIFDEVAANYAGKKKEKKDRNGDVVDQKGKYQFVEADTSKKLKKGAKKGVKKFKSKSKFKRR